MSLDLVLSDQVISRILSASQCIPVQVTPAQCTEGVVTNPQARRQHRVVLPSALGQHHTLLSSLFKNTNSWRLRGPSVLVRTHSEPSPGRPVLHLE